MEEESAFSEEASESQEVRAADEDLSTAASGGKKQYFFFFFTQIKSGQRKQRVFMLSLGFKNIWEIIIKWIISVL